jgi:hypothetical protein
MGSRALYFAVLYQYLNTHFLLRSTKKADVLSNGFPADHGQ